MDARIRLFDRVDEVKEATPVVSEEESPPDDRLSFEVNLERDPPPRFKSALLYIAVMIVVGLVLVLALTR